jgi:hypothetical protein
MWVWIWVSEVRETTLLPELCPVGPYSLLGVGDPRFFGEVFPHQA